MLRFMVSGLYCMGYVLFGSSVICRVVVGLCCMDRFDVVGYVLGLLFRVMVVWLGLG